MRIFILALIVVFQTGCAIASLQIHKTKYSIQKKQALEGHGYADMDENYMAEYSNGKCKLYVMHGRLSRSWVKLGIRKFTSEKGKDSILIYMKFEGRSWIFVRKGESLKFIVDGKKMTLKTSDVTTDNFIDMDTNRISESAFYDVSSKQLKKLLNADDLKFIIDAKKVDWEGCVPEYALNNMRRFAIEELKLKGIKKPVIKKQKIKSKNR